MNLVEVGAFLKMEREKRRLSLDDVAGRLKINPRLLTALEAGNESGLPHQAYVRGFIRSYASILGLGHAEIQDLLVGVPPARVASPAQPEAEGVEMPAPGGAGHSGGRVFLSLILLCVLLGGAYWAWQAGWLVLPDMDREKTVTLEDRLPGADAYLAARETQSGQKQERAPEKVPAAQEFQTSVPAAVPVPARQPVAEPPKADLQPPEPVFAKPLQEPARQHKLIITATEECWVHSNADNTDTRQFSLRKGDTFALTFAKSLELKLGNAGGVRLRYDGADLPSPGTSGQVKTVTFPPQDN